MDLGEDLMSMLFSSNEEESSSSSESSSGSSVGSSSTGMDLEESSDSSELIDSSDDERGHARVVDFMVTCGRYSDSDFKRHFRLNRSTVHDLIDRYKSSEYDSHGGHTGGKKRVGADREMYMLVWYISNTLTFRQLGNLFGVCDSTAWNVVKRTSKWLISQAKDYIRWPQGNEIVQSQDKFRSKKGIPGIIGAIDGSHIRIKMQSSEIKTDYINRKGYSSILLQAVVDADKKFIDVYCGEPGSLHDARVLRRSDLFDMATTNMSQLFPNNTFIIGDSAYGVQPWLVPPFKDNGNLSDQQKQFNFIHSSTRMVVENAFGLLKGRFRRILHFQENTTTNFVVNTVICACILHNICIISNDHFDSNHTEEEEDVSDSSQNANTASSPENRRTTLFNFLVDNNIIH